MTTRAWPVIVAAWAILLGLAAPVASAQDGPTVTRLAGDTRVGTAVDASRAGWSSAQVVLLASSEDFPDALVAGSLGARADAPLLLVSPDTLDAEVRDELLRLGPTEVIVLGGRAAVSDDVLDAVRASLGVTPRRLAGDDRYETAARVALDRATTDPAIGGVVAVATGEAFPDALTAASLPDGLGGRATVLLTLPDRLPSATEQALRTLAPSDVLVTGGAASVSDGVLAAIERVTGRAPVRLAGPSRYATSAAALSRSVGTASASRPPLLVATGEDFPDALATGTLAARRDGLVVLAPRFRLADEVEALVRQHRDRWSTVTVLGGDRALDRDLVADLEAAVSGAPRPPASLEVRTSAAGFRGVARELTGDEADRMAGVTWRPGCPVGLDGLAMLELSHRTFDGTGAEGRLVVARSVVSEVLLAFATLHDGGFPIARMVPIEAYGGDDDASIADNNTSAFNCRTVAGTSRWSNHAYGLAIDVNPVQNPYVDEDGVQPPAGAAYLDRGDVRPGMAVRPGLFVDTFDDLGWGWGGDYRTIKDYHHVEYPR